MNSPDDYGQNALLQKLLELHPELSRELLLICYRIEKEHQFDKDPDVVVNQLRSEVNRFIDEETSKKEDAAKKESR